MNRTLNSELKLSVVTTKPEQFHHEFVYSVKTAKRMEHAPKLLRLFTSPEKCARKFEHCAFERHLRKKWHYAHNFSLCSFDNYLFNC